jgi:hypothetical protein
MTDACKGVFLSIEFFGVEDIPSEVYGIESIQDGIVKQIKVSRKVRTRKNVLYDES